MRRILDLDRHAQLSSALADAAVQYTYVGALCLWSPGRSSSTSSTVLVCCELCKSLCTMYKVYDTGSGERVLQEPFTLPTNGGFIHL